MQGQQASDNLWGTVIASNDDWPSSQCYQAVGQQPGMLQHPLDKHTENVLGVTVDQVPQQRGLASIVGAGPLSRLGFSRRVVECREKGLMRLRTLTG